MTGKLKLGALLDDKPVRITVELPAQVHRDLVAYGEALAREIASPALDPAKLVGPMLARFMATDRAFAKARRRSEATTSPGGDISGPAAPDVQPGERG